MGPGAGITPVLDGTVIDATNPFNPFGVDLDGSNTTLVYRRFIEGGPRQFEQKVDTIYGVATLDGIVRFTSLDEPLVRRTLDRLIARGDVVLDASRGEEYRLSGTGRHEAARRFAAEFAPMLSQGHGECSDPDCDCHTSEGSAAECHARSRPHTH